MWQRQCLGPTAATTAHIAPSLLLPAINSMHTALLQREVFGGHTALQFVNAMQLQPQANVLFVMRGVGEMDAGCSRVQIFGQCSNSLRHMTTESFRENTWPCVDKSDACLMSWLRAQGLVEPEGVGLGVAELGVLLWPSHLFLPHSELQGQNMTVYIHVSVSYANHVKHTHIYIESVCIQSLR